MPQMMPCSWMLIFFLGSMTFLLMNSNWSMFFFVFPNSMKSSSKKSLGEKTYHFWI